MENKRLSTIAFLTKHYNSCCEVFFNGCRACVFLTLNIKLEFNPNFQSHFLCILLLIICNVLRYFRSKGRRLAPFSENFQKEQDKIWTRNYPVFLSVPHAALLVCWSTSLFKTLFLNFLSVKSWYVFVNVYDGWKQKYKRDDGSCNIQFLWWY